MDLELNQLLGQIEAETARLRAALTFAPDPIRNIALETIQRQGVMVDPKNLHLVDVDVKYRAMWLIWANQEVELLRSLTKCITG